MSADCRELQAILASGGPQVLREDETAQRHVSECTECFDFLEAVAELETSLTNLPRLDAPQSVVEVLMARPELGTRARSRRSLVWEAAVAAGVVLAVLAGVLWRGQRQTQSVPPPVTIAQTGPEASPPLFPPVGSEARKPPSARKESPRVPPSIFTEIDSVGSAIAAGPPGPPVSEPVATVPRQDGGLKVRVYDKKDNSPIRGAIVELADPTGEEKTRAIQSDVEGQAVFPDVAKGEAYRVKITSPGFAPVVIPDQRVAGDDSQPVAVGMSDEIQERLQVVAHREVVDLENSSAKDLPIPGRFYKNLLTVAPGVSDGDGDGNVAVRGSRVGDFKMMVGGVTNVDPLTGLAMNSINPASIEEIEVVSAGVGVQYGRAPGGYSPATTLPIIDSVRTFLAERASVTGLSFIEPKGYWANTYVPGDPALRLLAARLANANRASLPESFRTTLRLHDASRRAPQPFDAPDGEALAVYLSADHRNLAGEGRLLVQVGIEGTPRRGGRRPPMNLGVVLDLRGENSIETATGMRALIAAIAAAREQGDRVNLVVAGRPGGLVVGADKFRHGPLMVALDRLLSGSDSQNGSLGIVEALARAIETVANVDDPDRPLGSSAVLLVTGQPLGAFTSPIAALAHQSAVAGFPVSVVGIGAGVTPAEIDRVSLAGQGRRRLMKAAAEASGLIDRELSAVTRAIAGAVRLRIRLADGVKLVGVLGSTALDEMRAQQVRTAETSIDLRLARNLGVASDRGEDEDGIQIFIPNFYASDTHVILLDVVAPGPGAIADVQLRYKDLVALRNGVARATLRVGRGPDVAGPIERNVLKNLLALRLSDTLEKAGSALASGDRAVPRALLSELRELLAGARREVTGFESDPDLADDIGMLSDYLTLLESSSGDGAGRMAYLADSLRYAARLKVLPRPMSE